VRRRLLRLKLLLWPLRSEWSFRMVLMARRTEAKDGKTAEVGEKRKAEE